jgi:hypothetical protein
MRQCTLAASTVNRRNFLGAADAALHVVEFKGSHFEREIILWGVR